MYQLRRNCLGSSRSRRPRLASGLPTRGRSAAERRHRHDDGLDERAARHRGQAGGGDGTPVVADDDIGVGGVTGGAHLQRVVHHRPDVVAAVGGDRRGHIAAHERGDDPVAGGHQVRRQFPESVGGVGKTVQAQGNWAVVGSPAQRAQLYRRRRDVNPAWLHHRTPRSLDRIEPRDEPTVADLVQSHPHAGGGVGRRVGAHRRRSGSRTAAPRRGRAWPTPMPRQGTWATAEIFFSLAPGMTTLLTSWV